MTARSQDRDREALMSMFGTPYHALKTMTSTIDKFKNGQGHLIQQIVSC